MPTAASARTASAKRAMPIGSRRVLRRLASMAITLLGILAIVLGVLHLGPGEPAPASTDSADRAASVAAQRARFREEHLLDRPFWIQFAHHLGPFDLSPRGHRLFGGDHDHPYNGVLALEFGREFHRPHVDVRDELGRRLLVTLPLAAAAALLAYAIAIPLGVLCALRRGRWIDRAASAVLLALDAIPAFWAAALLVFAFGATGLGWLPVLGLRGADAASLSGPERALDLLRHALLPVIVLAYGGLAYVARQMRSSMIEALGQPSVRALRARGVSERRILWLHAFRHAAFPMLNLLAQVLPALIGGSIVVETVFQIQGVGRYAFDALLARDYNVLFATTTVAALVVLVALLLADLAYAWLDPRVRDA